MYAGGQRLAYPSRATDRTVPVQEVGALPDWVTVYTDGRILVAPPRNTKAGQYTITVGTPAGERDTVTINVVEPGKDAARIDPEYRLGFVRAGKVGSNQPPSATIDRSGTKYTDQPLPVGTKYGSLTEGAWVDGDGVVKLEAPIDTKPGTLLPVKVALTYPDGSMDTVDATFEVITAEFAQLHQPAYQTGKGAKPGQKVSVRQVTGGLPNYTEYTLKDPNADFGGWDVTVELETGEIRATAPKENAQPLEVDIHVSYADGTGEDITAHIGVLEGETIADQVESLEYSEPEVCPDGSIEITPKGKVPSGIRFEKSALTALPVTVDRYSGAITITIPPDTPVDANFDAAVSITLPDGSRKDIVVPITTTSQALTVPVTWKPAALPNGGLPQTVEPFGAPEGTTFALGTGFNEKGWDASVNPKTGAVTVARQNEKGSPENVKVPVVVSFPDGSQRVVEVSAVAVSGMAAATPVTYPYQEVRAGETATLKPSTKAADATYALLNPVPGLQLSIDPATGALTAKALPDAVPGLRNVAVQVTFEDTTQIVTNARVFVLTEGGQQTLAAATKLPNAVITAPAGATVRTTLPVPKGANPDRPFELGAVRALGWQIMLNEHTGEFLAMVPPAAAGQRVRVPVTVLFEDGSEAIQHVTVAVAGKAQKGSKDGSSAGGSSRSSEGSSSGSSETPWWVPLLAVLGLLGALGWAAHEHQDFLRTLIPEGWWKNA